jgi:chemotaxis protein CheZ
MPVQRKVFRIEERARPTGHGGIADSALHRDFMTELQSLREMIEPRMTQTDRAEIEKTWAQITEARAYKHELGLIHAAVERARDDMAVLGADAQRGEDSARASRELAAIVGGTEKATQAILQAAEEIDHAAGTLSAALKTGHDKGLAHDIQERVVQIFEACNFQDLTGQRVAHVIAMLKSVEERIARLLLIWQDVEQLKPAHADESKEGDWRFLNGPKLPSDRGHATQDDIDGMFRVA